MYSYGRKVYVKSLKQVGAIVERGRHRTGGKAWYVVEFRDYRGDFISDYMTGSSDLRPADYCCDGCGGWRKGEPHAWGRDGEYEHGMAFCWLCAGEPAEEAARRDQERYYEQMLEEQQREQERWHTDEGYEERIIDAIEINTVKAEVEADQRAEIGT